MVKVASKFAFVMVSKKVPKSVVPSIRRLQAQFQLASGRRISEADVIARAVEHLETHEDVLVPASRAKYTLLDLIGLVKGGGSRTSAAKELDEVVYGDVRP